MYFPSVYIFLWCKMIIAPKDERTLVPTTGLLSKGGKDILGCVYACEGEIETNLHLKILVITPLDLNPLGNKLLRL